MQTKRNKRIKIFVSSQCSGVVTQAGQYKELAPTQSMGASRKLIFKAQKPDIRLPGFFLYSLMLPMELYSPEQ